MHSKLAVVILVLGTISVFTATAYDWPVNEPVVTSTFGSQRWGSFGNGIEVRGGSPDILPSEKGEMIFYSDSSGPGALPAGLDDFIVLEHERKLRTLYAGIEPFSEIDEVASVSGSDVLGRTGSLGDSDDPGLYFAVIDSEFEQYVNPLLLLNSIIDNRSPVIDEIRVVNSSGTAVVDRKAVVSSGLAEIAVRIFDPCMSDDFESVMAPYKIQLFLNGEEVFYLNFESLRYEQPDAVIQSRREHRYSDFYREDGFISLGDITLVPGESRFEVLVSDYSDNETGRTFSLTVVEQE